MLIDEHGAMLHRWELKDRSSWYDAWVTPRGELLVISGWDPTRKAEFPDEKGFPSMITKFSPDSRILWRKPLAAHHDVRVLPNGMILALTEQPRTIPSNRRAKTPSLSFMDNSIVLLTASGDLVQQRSVYDLVRSTPKLRLLDTGPVVTEGAYDLFHCNAAQWIDDALVRSLGKRPASSAEARRLYKPGNVIFSSRHQNFVAIFSWQSKRVLWAWGQQRDGLDGPHAASLLPNGNVLVYDNGLLRGYSRILEIDPLSNRIVWQFQAKHPQDFYNRTGGHVQKLAGGNVLLTDSSRYQVLEVTPEQRIVWKWINPERTFVYRMTRLPYEYFETSFRARLQGAGGPLRTENPR